MAYLAFAIWYHESEVRCRTSQLHPCVPDNSLGTQHWKVAPEPNCTTPEDLPLNLVLFIPSTSNLLSAMLPQIPLYALCLVHGAFAFVLPLQSQVPILVARQEPIPRRIGVLIAYRRHGENCEATIQIPLRQPLRGMLVPGRSAYSI